MQGLGLEHAENTKVRRGERMHARAHLHVLRILEQPHIGDAASAHACQQLELRDLSAQLPILLEAGSKAIFELNGRRALSESGGAAAPIDKTTNEVWEHSIAINLTAPFQYLRAAVPAMKEAKFGRIIVIASSAGLIGEPNVSAYTAAKHGVIGLVRAAAAELGKYGITVNAVCPSYVDTPMTKRSLEAAAARTGKDFNEVKAALEAKQPIGRFLTPKEVANAAIAFIDLPDTTGQAEILKGE